MRCWSCVLSGKREEEEDRKAKKAADSRKWDRELRKKVQGEGGERYDTAKFTRGLGCSMMTTKEPILTKVS